MNFFALSSVITAVLTVLMCSVILLNNFKDKTNRAWFLSCASIFIWTVGLSGTMIVDNGEDALFWQRILYIGTILIPIFFFYFCLNLLGREKNNKSLFIGFLLSIFFIFLSFSKFFIVGVKDRVDFGYWPVQTGSFYFLFLLYFAFYVIYSVILLKIDSRKYDGVYQKQIQYVYYAALIGFAGGSTNFLLDFNINTYSIGNYIVILYIIFISYAVFKHQLFDIKIIATELLVFTLWIILLMNVFFSFGSSDFLLSIIVLISIIIAGVLLIRSVIKEVKQKEKMEKMAKEIEKAYEVEKKAKEELEELDKIKNQFLAVTQHDMRTPLTSIIGYTDLLMNGTFGKQPKKTLEVADKIQQVAQNMKKKAESFLDTAQFKLGKGVLSLKSGVELQVILNEIISELKFKTEEKGIYLKSEEPDKNYIITADREKLKTSLFNIIDNAVKYTKEGGVEIKLKTENEKVKIKIKDTGIGITSEKIKTLFESKFERSEDAKKTAEGKGIGLYLAGQIIKLHNGKVWVESEGEGKGSTFYVELPYKNDEKFVVQETITDNKI